MNGIFFDFNNYLSVTNSFVSNFLFKIRYYLPDSSVYSDVYSMLYFSVALQDKATAAARCLNLDSVVFDSRPLIVVCHLQGALVYPHTHEFSSLADAVYFLRVCRIRCCCAAKNL